MLCLKPPQDETTTTTYPVVTPHADNDDESTHLPEVEGKVFVRSKSPTAKSARHAKLTE